MQTESYSKKILKNGLTVLSVPLKSTKAVTVLVLCKVGSRYENEKVYGGAHFIEHLFFKGTRKRPNTIDISQELDAIGAEFNAFTGKEYTGYYVKCASPKLGIAVDVLSDMLLHSLFDEKELNQERGVIVEEINMYHDNPLMRIHDLFEETLYEGNLSRDIAGTPKDIKEMKREDLLSFRDEYYAPENMVVCVSGDISKYDVPTLIEEYFQFQEKKIGKTFNEHPYTDKNKKVALEYRKTSQSQMILGFPSYGRHDKNRLPLKVLSVILGENMSSRLFISVRERRGLCYVVRSSADFYEEIGSFCVQAGLDKERMYDAVKVILEELMAVKNEGVTKEELQKAKDYLSGKMILNLEDSSEKANFYAKGALLEKKLKTPDELLKEIKDVTLEDVKRVAQEIFDAKKAHIAVIGPFKEEEKFLEIIKSFY